MTEERITETTDAAGNVTERTIERNVSAAPVTVNTGERSGGGMGGIFLIVLLALVAVGGYFLYTNGSEVRKDDAVAKAANDVGDAAQKAGDAVEKAADKLAN